MLFVMGFLEVTLLKSMNLFIEMHFCLYGFYLVPVYQNNTSWLAQCMMKRKCKGIGVCSQPFNLMYRNVNHSPCP